MRLIFIAFQFLTIIPLPFDTRCEKGDLGRSTAFFPLVGLSIGALLAGIDWLMSPWLSRPLCDALLITFLAAITGALHLDGLADVCDGLAARGGKERFLEVMKDSRVGAVGVAGLVLALLLKWQALIAVPEGLKWQALLLFPVLARFGQVAAMTGARHARSDGLGLLFVQGMGKLQPAAAFAATIIIVLLLQPVAGGAAFAAVLLISLTLRAYFTGRLGGLTGDIIGCTNELCEIAVLVILSLHNS